MKTDFGNSGLTLSRAIHAGDLTTHAAMELSISAIDANEHEVRAFTHLQLDTARSGAKSRVGPLAGLAVGIKDTIDTSDMPTEYGSPIYKDWRPASDAPIVSMVKRAGGTVIGKTVTTEFAAAFAGATTNPHNSRHTPGGSSSGSAAGVAAGMIPLAIGSQTAGSIIRPAAFCGVAGFKPSFGLLPTSNVKCFSWTLDTLGLFGKQVSDVAFFATALTGRSYNLVPLSTWRPRIGIVKTAHWQHLSEDMLSALDQAVEMLIASGGTIVQLQASDVLDRLSDAQATIQNYEVVRSLAFEHDTHPNELSDWLRNTLDHSRRIPVAAYAEAMSFARGARRQVLGLFHDVDVMLSPSAYGAAPDGLVGTGDPAMCRAWTLLGYPCVNVPGIQSKDQMPLGLQIIGKYGDDEIALKCAHWLEQAITSYMKK